MCGSVWQCAAVRSSLLQRFAQCVRCMHTWCHRGQCWSVLKCAAVCCSVLRCVAVRCSALWCIAVRRSASQCVAVRRSASQCVAVRRSASQCVAVRRSALQCAAVWCFSVWSRSVIQCDCAHLVFSLSLFLSPPPLWIHTNTSIGHLILSLPPSLSLSLILSLSDTHKHLHWEVDV